MDSPIGLVFRQSLLRIVAVPLVLLALGTGAALLEIRRLVQANELVDHTTEIVDATDELGDALHSMVLSGRGMARTSDEEFRRIWEESATRAQTSLGTLEELVADAPPQLAAVRDLRASLNDVVMVGQPLLKGKGDASAIGAALDVRVPALRAQAAAFRVSESALRGQRVEALRSFTDATYATVTAVLILVGGVLLFFVRRQIEALAVTYAAAVRTAQQRERELEEQNGQLRRSEERFRSLVDSMTDLVFTVRPDGRYDEVFGGWLRAEGVPPEVIRGKTAREVVRDPERAAAHERATKRALEGNDARYEFSFDSPKGRREFEATIAPLRIGGRVEGAVGVAREVTAHREAARKLEESEERFRLLVENVTDYALVLLDAETRIASWNPGAERIYGHAAHEVLGQSVDVLFTEADREAGRPRILFGEVRASGSFHTEGWRRRKDGSAFWAEIAVRALRDERGGIQGFSHVAKDLSEKRKLQDQLAQSQKMEAVGQLAGGVAHDFNNLLTAILSFTGFVRDDLPKDSPMREDLEEAISAARRAATLTRQLLAFSRKQMLQPQSLDLNAVVAGSHKLLERLLGEDIDLRVVPASGLAPVWADPGQLEQVIVNLAVNARDAMPRGGKLTLETSEAHLDPATEGRLGARAGRYAVLAVSDTGTGMDETTVQRIFEPFFTTKPVGKGTGLGLSTVFGIVKQSGGDVRVYTEVGKGTTFRIYLPFAERQAGAASVEAEEAPGGTECILVVEDEPVVRMAAKRTLSAAGYRVFEAATPLAALALLGTPGGPRVDLLLTDVVMPDMSGKQLADRAAALLPGLRIMFMSGYTDGALTHHGVLQSGAGFLEKPFTAHALLRKVRQVLTRAG